MNADGIRDYELHPGETDPVARQTPPPRGRGRIAQIEHNLGFRLRHGGDIQLDLADLSLAFIDETLVAFRAGDGHLLPRMQQLGGVPRTDDCRQAKLAAHDRRVRCASAMIGDDRLRPLHDRHPVGIGGRCHQDGAIDELIDIGRPFDQTDLTRDHGVADRDAGTKRAAFLRDFVTAQHCRTAPRLYCLRSGLHDVHLAGNPVASPLHIHRTAVVLLDGHRPAGKIENLPIGQHVAGPLALGGRNVACRRFAARVDHLDGLGAQRLRDDRGGAGTTKQRLEHLVFVGIDSTLHDVFAQPPGGVDQDDLVEAGLGVEGEHHTRSAQIGAHHFLDPDREGDLGVLEAFGFAVRDGAVGEQRRIAALACEQQIGLTFDVEEGLLLARETRVRKILGRSAGADGDSNICVSSAS
jgi:hypothetical protein